MYGYVYTYVYIYIYRERHDISPIVLPQFTIQNLHFPWPPRSVTPHPGLSHPVRPHMVHW